MTKSKPEVKVVVSKNGPYLVSGGVPLAKQTIVSDAEGNSEDWKQGAPLKTEDSYALCRCGHSKNKPFCDDAHFDAGFYHTATALDGKTGDIPEGAGPMNIEPLLNGPNFITGSFEIISSDGKVVCRGSKTALCRCGHSENKPFCDGSHREKGFEAPVLGG